nr:alcohol dehydrogenase catalytic domain-containing protein [Streptomyces sp. S1D4-11]
MTARPVPRSRALVLEEFDQPLKLREFDLPPAPAGGLVVACGYGGVCGTDLHLQKGHLAVPTPLVLGHEGLGVVHELGPGTGVDAVNTAAGGGCGDVGLLHRLRRLRALPPVPGADAVRAAPHLRREPLHGGGTGSFGGLGRAHRAASGDHGRQTRPGGRSGGRDVSGLCRSDGGARPPRASAGPAGRDGPGPGQRAGGPRGRGTGAALRRGQGDHRGRPRRAAATGGRGRHRRCAHRHRRRGNTPGGAGRGAGGDRWARRRSGDRVCGSARSGGPGSLPGPARGLLSGDRPVHGRR